MNIAVKTLTIFVLLVPAGLMCSQNLIRPLAGKTAKKLCQPMVRRSFSQQSSSSSGSSRENTDAWGRGFVGSVCGSYIGGYVAGGVVLSVVTNCEKCGYKGDIKDGVTMGSIFGSFAGMKLLNTPSPIRVPIFVMTAVGSLVVTTGAILIKG